MTDVKDAIKIGLQKAIYSLDKELLIARAENKKLREWLNKLGYTNEEIEKRLDS
jgi:hypothetical protein